MSSVVMCCADLTGVFGLVLKMCAMGCIVSRLSDICLLAVYIKSIIILWPSLACCPTVLRILRQLPVRRRSLLPSQPSQ